MGGSGDEALLIRLTEPLRAMPEPKRFASSSYGCRMKYNESGKPSFLNTHSTAEEMGGLMFGRKKKDEDTIGETCPYCEFVSPLGSETCAQCYYSLKKSAREQPMAEPTTSGDEIMSLLMGENEDIEDEKPVVEAVLSLEDVTVEVDQYALAEASQDGEEAPPESFDFISSSGPTLSQTVASSENEEEEHHLTPEDMPSTPVKFEIDSVDPLAEVAEPVHTGKGGLFSPSVATPKDDDLLGSVGPSPGDATPDLPDLPDDVVATPSLAQAMAGEVQVPTPELPATAVESTSPTPTVDSQTPTPQAAVTAPATPSLPDLPDEDPVAEPAAEPTSTPAEVVQEAAAPVQDPNRIWPWPKAEAWTNTQIYQEVVKAMEHIKQGQMESAAATLDTLGPHLDLNLDMLLHISVLMQHLGRHDHVKWTLDMAAYVYPADPHVQQARAQLLA